MAGETRILLQDWSVSLMLTKTKTDSGYDLTTAGGPGGDKPSIYDHDLPRIKAGETRESDSTSDYEQSIKT